MSGQLGRVSRVGLAVVGLVLLAGGVLALLRGTGLFGAGGPDTALLAPGTEDYVATSGWFWLAAGVAAALVALAGLGWLLALLRPEVVRRVTVEPDDRRGATRVSATAVTDALEDEVESYRGVRRAHARLTRSTRYPALTLHVGVTADAHLGQVRARIEREALAHLRQALGQDQLPARIRIHAGTRRRTPRHLR
ncbi:alkaline shock response membrane anchor protein AmaP [Peterkaempfera bronchialis]|uniref:Alkaline shock response membrane anchor protein AmaP n=1 Tax=Peterkaempfera bronchialis TaxID=2126346 RepID=A0A345SZC1_9ACTN|nr:alkaline shock response membrane anchor protein AmaP [Peterkaempfera bronchialis]AXI79076.1 alkaline shock response membrane anchor protein AmaP [Peterkaempfera bronchialis]